MGACIFNESFLNELLISLGMGRARTISYNYCKYRSLVRIERVHALVILNVLGHELSLSLQVLLTALVVALFLIKLTQFFVLYSNKIKNTCLNVQL